MRDKITNAETFGSVQGVGFCEDEISIKLVKKKLFSDQPLIRVELVRGKYLETQCQNADITVHEAE